MVKSRQLLYVKDLASFSSICFSLYIYSHSMSYNTLSNQILSVSIHLEYMWECSYHNIWDSRVQDYYIDHFPSLDQFPTMYINNVLPVNLRSLSIWIRNALVFLKILNLKKKLKVLQRTHLVCPSPRPLFINKDLENILC